MKGRARTVWVYGLASLLMTMVIWIFWTFVPLFLVVRLADSDPTVKAALETAKIYQLDSLEVNSSGPRAEKRLEVLKPIFARLNWFAVALLTSVLSFSCLGYFVGYSSGEPNWAGLLPLLAIIGQLNPAVMPNLMEYQGFAGLGLSFWQQVVVLMVQMAVVYAGAFWGAERLQRRLQQLQEQAPEPDDELEA